MQNHTLSLSCFSLSLISAKKKKEIRRLKKDRRAKARVLRKEHGGTAKKSILGTTSTPFTDPSKRRSTRLSVNGLNATLTEYFDKNETGLSAIMSGEPEPECEISERIVPKEDDEESDAMMAEADESDVETTTAWAASQEYNNEGDISMSTSPPKSDGIFDEKRTPAVPNQGMKSIVETKISSLTNVSGENGVSVSATLTNSDTTTGSKTDGNFNCSFASMTLAVSSESSEFDSVQSEPSLL